MQLFPKCIISSRSFNKALTKTSQGFKSPAIACETERGISTGIFVYKQIDSWITPCTTLYSCQVSTKSQNRRTVEVGNGLWRSFRRYSQLRQDQIEQVAQDHVQWGYEYLQELRLHSLLVTQTNSQLCVCVGTYVCVCKLGFTICHFSQVFFSFITKWQHLLEG